MSRVTVYSTANCAFCVRAKSLLGQLNIDFDDIAIDTDDSAQQEFARVTNGARTVPQILIDDQLIGGFTELAQLHKDGGLSGLLPS